MPIQMAEKLQAATGGGGSFSIQGPDGQAYTFGDRNDGKCQQL